VDNKSTINLSTNIAFNNYKPLYIIWAFTRLGLSNLLVSGEAD